MQQKKLYFLFGFGALALVLVGAACKKTTPPQVNNQVQQQEQVSATDGESVNVTLASLGGSTQTGSATLTEMDGNVRVSLLVSGGDPAAVQPVHIHAGTCAQPGDVLYPLTNIERGVSETVLDTTLGALRSQKPLAIVVHKSAAEAGVYTACGDFEKQEGTSMEEESPTSSAIKINTNVEIMEKKNEGAAMENAKKSVAVTAKNFSFSQKEIRVKKGDTVQVALTVQEGFHDFVVEGYNVRTAQMGIGNSETVEFTADKAGMFEYYCSVGEHRKMGMVGKLIVE